MKSIAPPLVAPSRRPLLAGGLARRLVLSRLARLERGLLDLVEGEARQHFGREDARSPLRATLEVTDDRTWSSLLARGSVGAAEAFMQGWWRTDDLTALVRLLVRNQEVLAGLEGGLAATARPFLWLYHRLRDNDRGGSRRNIAAHYDLSNAFFSTFLDPTMTYSCGIFERPESTLEEASIAKIDRLCRRLELGPDDHLVEIGTGWGALAIHAAREYGCRVTTTTISREQHDFARRRIDAARLSDRIELRFQDYRDLDGTYDKAVSVEMIEAVGHRHYDAFFATCARLLKPEGRMLIQAITIADQHYERAKRSVDFIQRYIFPGSCIPSVTALVSSMTAASDLRLVGLDDITPHYVRTLAEWRENLLANLVTVRALGFGDEFVRMWEFYFCYCEGGFAERHIGDVHLLLAKPACELSPELPRLPELRG